MVFWCCSPPPPHPHPHVSVRKTCACPPHSVSRRLGTFLNFPLNAPSHANVHSRRPSPPPFPRATHSPNKLLCLLPLPLLPLSLVLSPLPTLDVVLTVVLPSSPLPFTHTHTHPPTTVERQPALPRAPPPHPSSPASPFFCWAPRSRSRVIPALVYSVAPSTSPAPRPTHPQLPSPPLGRLPPATRSSFSFLHSCLLTTRASTTTPHPLVVVVASLSLSLSLPSPPTRLAHHLRSRRRLPSQRRLRSFRYRKPTFKTKRKPSSTHLSVRQPSKQNSSPAVEPHGTVQEGTGENQAAAAASTSAIAHSEEGQEQQNSPTLTRTTERRKRKPNSQRTPRTPPPPSVPYLAHPPHRQPSPLHRPSRRVS